MNFSKFVIVSEVVSSDKDIYKPDKSIDGLRVSKLVLYDVNCRAFRPKKEKDLRRKL